MFVPLHTSYYLPYRDNRSTYLNKMTLTHALTTVKSACELCMKNVHVLSPYIGPQYWESTHTISKIASYFEQLNLHCKEIWNVPLFNCEPQMEVHFGSAAHAEWILTAFLKCYVFLSWKLVDPRESTLIPPEHYESLTSTMLGAMIMLTAIVVHPEEKFSEKIKSLKTALKKNWSLLITLKKQLRFTESCIYDFLGDEYLAWTELCKLFCSNKVTHVLEKIAFSEFINASHLEWNKNIVKQKKHEKKDGKNKGVHQEYEVMAKEDKIDAVLNSTNKEPVQLVSQMTVEEGKVIETSSEKDKEPIHMMNNEKVKVTSDIKHNSQVDSKNADETASQQGSTIAVEAKSETPANSEKVQINKGSSSKFQVCSFCKKMETKQRTYKKCSLCKKEKWDKGHYFCSEECEANDWIEMHRAVHKPQ